MNNTQFVIRIGKKYFKSLIGIGISSKNAQLIQGQPCKPTGRSGAKWKQVEFNGNLIGWNEPFLFCVPIKCMISFPPAKSPRLLCVPFNADSSGVIRGKPGPRIRVSGVTFK